MANDTLTLSLGGEISLSQFVKAMEYFNTLINDLSDEVAASDIEWEVSQLESGSAIATIRGQAPNQEDVKKVVNAYYVVGQSLENGNPIPYSEKIAKSAHQITSVINGRITSVKFITPQATAAVSKPVLPSENAPKEKPCAIGVITGEVSAIWNQPIKLALIDNLFGLTVYCFLNEEDREQARDVWGKEIVVTGLIYRDPKTDRPLEVREVKNIELVSRSPKGSYKKARGILPRINEPAENIIRRYRNAI